MQNKLEVMLQLQDTMNSEVHPQWREQNYAWFRALWIECAELIDHYGYKWWKKQDADMQQVQLEVVDIWHFGLSMLIDGRDFSAIAKEITTQLDNKKENDAKGVIEACEALVSSVLTTRQFNVVDFWALLEASDMQFDQLFKQYVGKNVLNLFRQDHGYKEGSYIKTWNGKEDNEYLSEILNQQQDVDANFAETVMQTLEKTYQQVKAQQ